MSILHGTEYFIQEKDIWQKKVPIFVAYEHIQDEINKKKEPKSE